MSNETNTTDPLGKPIKNLLASSVMNKTVLQFVTERTKIENSHAAKYKKVPTSGNSEKAKLTKQIQNVLDTFLNQEDVAAGHIANFAAILDEQTKETSKFSKDFEQQIGKIIMRYNKIKSELEKQQADLTKACDKYLQKSEEAEKIQYDLEQKTAGKGTKKEINKLQNKHRGLQSQVNSADKDYQVIFENFSVTQKSFKEHVDKLSDQITKLMRERISRFQETINKICDLRDEYCTLITKKTIIINETINAINHEEEIKSVILEKGEQKNYPTCPELELYDFKKLNEEKERFEKQVEKVVDVKEEKSPQIEKVIQEKKEEKIEPQQITQPQQTQQITQPKQVEQETQQNYQQQQANTVMARALYDFHDTDPNCLAFYAGEEIEILDQSDPGWWTGRLNGKTGLAPASYLQIIVTQPNEEWGYIAISFAARDTDELTVEAGEKIRILQKLDGWNQVMNSRGQTGLIPSTILK
ncbi:fch and double sh3 domains protein [Anaeramoeba ignava]|uniref:Fch and double sh3 domains protein n=1 Tax=Anaeramoeba ignava TaxID=1746090 RepID=A0A9Q0R9C5_ANAIG|nr:fch and double sh3 domains protein [Anaeramoeba ignava]|eukprot:Anaeramoba_ignava/a484811_100.p1 GENE.a484811_100~~a484811_100.p1  ORF type:complete len:471 (+),score=163.25 a484811_100:61-1473(+)